jgi:hypothetical protein
VRSSRSLRSAAARCWVTAAIHWLTTASTPLFSLPSYNLINAGALSAREIGNDEAVDCTPIIEALADLDDWDDRYLLVEHAPLTG